MTHAVLVASCSSSPARPPTALARRPRLRTFPKSSSTYYEAVKRNVSAMVDKMPEEHFAYKPVPEVRSFGESVAHVADAQARNCNLASGAGSKTLDAERKKTKAELVAALKESFAICDAAFAALTDCRRTARWSRRDSPASSSPSCRCSSA